MRFCLVVLFHLIAAPLALAADPVVPFSESDPVMKAAIEDARRTLPRFLQDMPSDKPAPREASIKVGYPTAGGEGIPAEEHIWVTGFYRRTDGSFVGRLDDEPAYLPGLAMGKRIVFDESMVSDWCLLRRNLYYGCYTTRVILMKILSADDWARARSAFAADPVPPEWK